MNKPLVIYHGKCLDGFTGAWAFWRKFKDSFDYHPGQYGHKPPDTFDRDVYLVDFSYKRAVVEEIILTANKVYLLDHHASAIDDLWDLKGLDTSYSSIKESGAMIAWKFVADMTGDKKAPPEMLLHVQDRDLWLFNMKGTREISEFMFSQEYDFYTWNEMMTMSKHQKNVAITAGALVVKKHFKDINELLGQVRRKMEIGGYEVDVACLPYMMASDAGSIISLTQPFAATYYDTKDHRCFSLRSHQSNPAAVDVSEIAAMYGGGGHKHASGFKVLREHPLAKC